MQKYFSLTPVRLQLLFAGVATVLVLWHLLLPGYVLMLDWSAGPQSPFPYHDVSSFMTAPSSALIVALEHIVPAWVVQKILLIGLVFVLFYFPLRFYPWAVSKSTPYVASLVATLNPFVYERLLSGQWRVVLGYAFLFPLLYFLIHFSRAPSYKSASKVALTLVATGMWSIHFFAIGAVVTSLFSLVLLVCHSKERAYRTLLTTAKALAVACAIVSLSALYWVVPLVYYGDATLDTFDTAHFDAFATVRDPHVGAVGSVLTLRGFWLERHAWAEDYVLPPEPSPFVFYTAFALLFVVSAVGWLSLMRKKEEVFVGGALAVIFTLATIFAIGVSGYGVWYVTVWLFENSSLWSGFRDTHKWAGVLASTYALLFPLGLAYIATHVPRFKKAVLVFGLALPFCIAPQMLFGLYGQAHTVWYPSSWGVVAEMVQETPECKILVLPWHMYYAVSWNSGVLSSNPAGEAFPCAVLINRDPEIGTVGNAPNTTSMHSLVSETVTNNKLSPDLAIDVFRNAGVTHILFTDDVLKSDIFTYPFLRSESLELVYESDGVSLYTVKP